MGHPCPSFVPLLGFRPDPDFCRCRNMGPTGTSGHPFGPEVVLFWAAAGAILMITLLLFSLQLSKCQMMWTGPGLNVERGGSDVGSRFIPACDSRSAARAEARATFPALLSLSC